MNKRMRMMMTTAGVAAGFEMIAAAAEPAGASANATNAPAIPKTVQLVSMIETKDFGPGVLQIGDLNGDGRPANARRTAEPTHYNETIYTGMWAIADRRPGKTGERRRVFMKRYRLADLADTREGHFLKGIVPGDFLYDGGLGFKKPGERSHATEDHAHVHDVCEVFVILQGKGEMEINGRRQPVTTGDIIVVEPGEDHHLIADRDDPCVNIYCHAGPRRNERQCS